MNEVICYPRCCVPEFYEEDKYYFEMFSTPEKKASNVGYVGTQFFKEIRKSKILPTETVFDFAIIAMAVVAADKAILRANSQDGWTRQIRLTVYLHNSQKWNAVKKDFEWMLRFLSGDFWYLNLKSLPESLLPKKKYELRTQDCICLLSGGMDSLTGAIDLYESNKNPLFVSQLVKGDAQHQRDYAALFGTDNLCQWRCYVGKTGQSEISTRTRSIIFYAFALLASCSIDFNERGRKEIFVPENGFISLNTPLDPLRIGSLSTKTTHPVYMQSMQKIWNEMGLDVDLVLPYKYRTKGEVLLNCKNFELMKDNIFGSTSCGKYQRHGMRHCGVCIPCLVRRAAFQKAGLNDMTENGYCVDVVKNADSKDVAAAIFAIRQLEKYGIEKVIKGTLNFAEEEDWEEYTGVVNRGLVEIKEFLESQGVL